MSSNEIMGIENLLAWTMHKVVASHRVPMDWDRFEEQVQKLSQLNLSVKDLNDFLSKIRLGALNSFFEECYLALQGRMVQKLFFQEVIRYSGSLLKEDPEKLQQELQDVYLLRRSHFGNIPKIVASKELNWTEEALKWTYFEFLEAYERTLMWLNEKYRDEPIVERMKWFFKIYFPLEKKELLVLCEKHSSLRQTPFLVNQRENLEILVRILSHANLKIETEVRQALLFWKNEIRELHHQAQEEKINIEENKQVLKEKNIQFFEGALQVLFQKVFSELLQKKSATEIFEKLAEKYAKEKWFDDLVHAVKTNEESLVSMFLDRDFQHYIQNFKNKRYENQPLLYLGILYQCFFSGEMDLIIQTSQNMDLPFILRLASRELLYLKLIQQAKTKTGNFLVREGFFHSFEKGILSDQNAFSVRQKNLIQLSGLALKGFPVFSEELNQHLEDSFISIHSQILDINLFNQWESLNHREQEERLQLLKDSMRLFDWVSVNLAKREGKTPEQIRRNDFFLNRCNRVLRGLVEKARKRLRDFD